MNRGFPNKEFEERIVKVRYLMDKNNIDMLLITSPHNFRYFCGLDSYFWESPTRPWFLIIPLISDPVAVVPSIGEAALKNTWIKNVQIWQSPQPEDEGISALKNAILSISSNKCVIGCEFGNESQFRMPINDFEKLKVKLKKTNFVDASNIIWKLRSIKSKNEIKKIKKIISISSKAFDELPENLNKGQTEIEICNILKKNLLNLGADYILYMSGNSGKGGYNQIICDPSEKKLRNGDVLVIDTGSTKEGYFSDFNRNYGFGKISNDTKSAYKVLWEATEAAIEKARPGVTCSEIANTMSQIINKDKLISNSVGRMGHGLGLQVTEPPSIMSNDKTLLKKNMVITIEPSFEFAPDKMLVHEENILITDNGNELLTSRTPKKMPII